MSMLHLERESLLLKNGVESHTFEVLENCKSEELNDKEVYYIKLFSTFNSEMGLNLTSGGCYCKMSDVTKLKISKAHVGKVLSKSSNKALS